MESILFWTLLITALGIVLLLLLLIASERELKRQRAESTWLREKLKPGAALGHPDDVPDGSREENRADSARIAALEEELRASQEATAGMQTELERLQNENAGLRHETSQYAIGSPPLGRQPQSTTAAPEADEPGDSASLHQPFENKRRWRVLFGTSAIALLLAGGAGLYFRAPARQLTSPAVELLMKTLFFVPLKAKRSLVRPSMFL